MHDVVVYDMAWAAPRHALLTQVRPWISSSIDKFETFDQLFDSVVTSEFAPDD